MSLEPRRKIALQGEDADSSDPRKLAFDSKYTSIKIYKEYQGSAIVPASGSVTVNLIGVGFFSLAQLFIELTPSSGRWYGTPFKLISGEDTYVSGDFDDTGVNSTYATFKIINNTASEKTVKYTCYILGHNGK